MGESCRSCEKPLSEDREDERRFLLRMAFRFDGVEFAIPLSALCPLCRHQRRLAFRNERSLYHRTAGSGVQILSLYHPDPLWGEAYTVMPENEWRSDALDPYAYGREVDFNRPFFEQYAELHKAVPRMSIVNLQNDNSPYTSHTGYSKNCYMLPCSEHCEDCYYGRFLQSCRACVDCTSADRCELCYECFQVSSCYECGYLSLSQNCASCWFSEGLVGCTSCLFCTNLRRAEFHIHNRPVSKPEFERELAAVLESAESLESAYDEWSRLRHHRLRRAANIRNSEECSGDFVLESRGCRRCTDVTQCEDCEDVIIGYKLRDCRSSSNLYLDCELDYEVLGSTQLYHCAFCFYAFRSRDVLYSEYVYDSRQLFGCVGLTRASCCILNRRYEPAEYERTARMLVEHMMRTGEWGCAIPPRMSAFGYNETIAAEFAPLTRDEAVAAGFPWRDTSPRERAAVTRQHPPHRIADFDHASMRDVFACSDTGEPFKIIAPELEFYRAGGFPPPHRSPRARHLRRERLRFPMHFRRGTCGGCRRPLETNVPPQLEAYIRCEECFQSAFA